MTTTVNERELETATKPVPVVAVIVIVIVIVIVTVTAETETETPIETAGETVTENQVEIGTANETATNETEIATAETANETAKDPVEIGPSPPTQAITPHARNPDDPSANQTTVPELDHPRKVPKIFPKRLRKILTRSLAKLPIANESLGNNRIAGLSLRRKAVGGTVVRNVVVVD